MLRNRSIPNATVIPVLVYPDVREAVAWLTTAFGFAERVRVGEDHRSQMQVGDDGGVIVADLSGEQQPPEAGVVTHVIKVRVTDVDAQLERARTHGARVLQEPIEFEYASGSARWRTSPVIAGSSPRRCATWRRRNGADNCSTRSRRWSDPLAGTPCHLSGTGIRSRVASPVPRPGGGCVTDPSASSLHVAVHTDGEIVTMELAGEFDLDVAGLFSARANDAMNVTAAAVVVDLADLTFIDSTGVAALLELHHRLSAAGRSFRVINVGRQPASVFAMTGLTGSTLQIVEITEDST